MQAAFDLAQAQAVRIRSRWNATSRGRRREGAGRNGSEPRGRTSRRWRVWGRVHLKSSSPTCLFGASMQQWPPMSSAKEPKHMGRRERSDFDGPSVASLLSDLRERPESKSFVELRKKSSMHLYPGFEAGPTAIKLACLLFDHITINELSAAELDYLDHEMDTLEGGTRATAPLRRQARLMLRKALRFQDETKILRDEDVVVPIQWEGGLASMFQPASVGLAGQLIFLGGSEMHDLANEILGDEALGKLGLFSTPFGLSCLREHYPEDIAKNDLAIAIAVTEVVGLVELFQMTPLATDRRWHRALSVAMDSRQPVGSQASVGILGTRVLHKILPKRGIRLTQVAPIFCGLGIFLGFVTGRTIIL